MSEELLEETVFQTKPKVYIDGQAGTTGLNLVNRLKDREDLELLLIEDDQRHNDARRQELMNEADLIFLCLPDEAAIQASYWIEPEKKVIDTSTAHRTLWEYGFSDLDGHFLKNVQHSRRVANPGCHASGIIALLYPLVVSGLLRPDETLSCFSLTGYSGGGKKMIEEYETHPEEHEAATAYSLNRGHKHLKEIKKIAGLKKPLQFIPIVDNYYEGMAVFIPLAMSDLTRPMDRKSLVEFYRDWYKDSNTVFVKPHNPDRIPSNRLAGFDDLEIYVFGEGDQLVLCALLDNLGKGACGAAIQNMNLMLGLEETRGLHLRNTKNEE